METGALPPVAVERILEPTGGTGKGGAVPMGLVAFYVEVLAVVAVAGMLVRLLRNLSALPVPLEVRMARGRRLPPLSVVVPIIDEEDGLDTCLAAILAQGYPEIEVIVVDAREGRRPSPRQLLEPERAADPRVEFLSSRPATGWSRRNHALHAGCVASRNEWVLFLEPNVYLKDDGLVRAVGTACWRGVDVAMLIPGFTAALPAERLLVPFVVQLALTLLPVRRINDEDDPAVPAHASFLLFRRDAYDEVQRDRSIRGDLWYEVALARLMKAAGHRLLFMRGAELAIHRTPGRLEGIWKNWARSFNAASTGDRRWAVGASLLLLLLFTIPWLLALVAPVALIMETSAVAMSPWTGVLLMGSTHVLLTLTIRRWMRDAFLIDDSLAWMQPVAAAITTVMLVAATVHRGGLVGGWVDRLGLALGGREAAS